MRYFGGVDELVLPAIYIYIYLDFLSSMESFFVALLLYLFYITQFNVKFKHVV